eukprot:904662-Rhodomonas_salina.1
MVSRRTREGPTVAGKYSRTSLHGSQDKKVGQASCGEGPTRLVNPPVTLTWSRRSQAHIRKPASSAVSAWAAYVGMHSCSKSQGSLERLAHCLALASSRLQRTSPPSLASAFPRPRDTTAPSYSMVWGGSWPGIRRVPRLLGCCPWPGGVELPLWQGLCIVLTVGGASRPALVGSLCLVRDRPRPLSGRGCQDCSEPVFPVEWRVGQEANQRLSTNARCRGDGSARGECGHRMSLCAEQWPVTRWPGSRPLFPSMSVSAPKGGLTGDTGGSLAEGHPRYRGGD